MQRMLRIQSKVNMKLLLYQHLLLDKQINSLELKNIIIELMIGYHSLKKKDMIISIQLMKITLIQEVKILSFQKEE